MLLALLLVVAAVAALAVGFTMINLDVVISVQEQLEKQAADMREAAAFAGLTGADKAEAKAKLELLAYHVAHLKGTPGITSSSAVAFDTARKLGPHFTGRWWVAAVNTGPKWINVLEFEVSAEKTLIWRFEQKWAGNQPVAFVMYLGKQLPAGWLYGISFGS